jgi:hypothetical protein
MRAQKPIRSDIAWSTSDRIVVRGKDLPGEILGHMNLGDLAFLQITGRTATPEESNVFNAIVITLVEHGITPSAIVARMTYAGGLSPCRPPSRRDYAALAPSLSAVRKARRRCSTKRWRIAGTRICNR